MTTLGTCGRQTVGPMANIGASMAICGMIRRTVAQNIAMFITNMALYGNVMDRCSAHMPTYGLLNTILVKHLA